MSSEATASAPAATLRGLPEPVQTAVLEFLELGDVVRAGMASKELERVSLEPSLPCRLRVECRNCSEADCARLALKCRRAEFFEARVFHARRWSLRRRLGLFSANAAAAADQHELSLGAALSTNGGMARLRSLRVEMGAGDDAASLLEAVARNLCPNLELFDLTIWRRTLDRRRSADAAILQAGAFLPRLKALRLDGGRDLVVNLQVSPLLQKAPALESLALPNAPGARQWRPRYGDRHRRLRLNSESRLFLPPVAVVCGVCGVNIYDRLDSYAVGAPTQSHITFELYTNAPPDRARPAFHPDGRTQLNCQNNCHAAQFKFLLAGRGDFVDTRNFAFALACSADLARLKVLENGHHAQGREPRFVDDLSKHTAAGLLDAGNTNPPAKMGADDFDDRLDPLLAPLIPAAQPLQDPWKSARYSLLPPNLVQRPASSGDAVAGSPGASSSSNAAGGAADRGRHHPRSTSPATVRARS